MLPSLFGIFDYYVILIFVGAALAFLLLYLYFKKINFNKKDFLNILLNGMFALLIGLIFAVLFQNLYDLINNPHNYKFSFGLTFYGGLIGGVGGFFLLYFTYVKKRTAPFLKDILIIAPACITLAHTFGRIGCFLDGCCYGIESESIFAVYFPLLKQKVLPTQLFESGFLFLLSGLLTFLAFKFQFLYTFPIYMICYGTFRFLIEFIRGDYRGTFIPGISPSQFWCIILIILSGVVALMLYKFYGKKEITEKTN